MFGGGVCSFLGTYHVSALRELSQPLSATPLAEDTAACVCTYFLLTGAFVQLGLHVCIHTRLSCFINACVNTFLTYTRSSTAAKCQAPHDTRAYVCSMLISITTTSRYYSFQEVREAEPFSPFVVFFFFFWLRSEWIDVEALRVDQRMHGAHAIFVQNVPS